MITPMAAMKMFISTAGLIFVLVQRIHAQEHDEKQYCANENFKSDCGLQEVVIMKSALFGRLRLGKCIKIDLGFLGCTNDVLQKADALCSGKSVCDFHVGDEFHDFRPNACSELHLYLEASYTCVTVSPVSYCHSRGPQHVAVTGPGHLSSQSVIDAGCGGQRAPLVLQAQPGQQLNISLLDFGWSEDVDRCDLYGHVRDPRNNSTINICGGGARERALHESTGHTLEVTLADAVRRHDAPRFLIRYSAVGCPDLTPPAGSWVKRTGDSSTMGCEGDDHTQTWHLVCEGAEWKGVMGNCDKIIDNVDPQVEVVDHGFPIPNELAIVAVAAGAVLICCVIIMIGVVCVKYYKTRAAESIYRSGSWMQDEACPRKPQAHQPIYRPLVAVDPRDFGVDPRDPRGGSGAAATLLVRSPGNGFHANGGGLVAQHPSNASMDANNSGSTTTGYGDSILTSPDSRDLSYDRSYPGNDPYSSPLRGDDLREDPYSTRTAEPNYQGLPYSTRRAESDYQGLPYSHRSPMESSYQGLPFSSQRSEPDYQGLGSLARTSSNGTMPKYYVLDPEVVQSLLAARQHQQQQQQGDSQA